MESTKKLQMTVEFKAKSAFLEGLISCGSFEHLAGELFAQALMAEAEITSRHTNVLTDR